MTLRPGGTADVATVGGVTVSPGRRRNGRVVGEMGAAGRDEADTFTVISSPAISFLFPPSPSRLAYPSPYRYFSLRYFSLDRSRDAAKELPIVVAVESDTTLLRI